MKILVTGAEGFIGKNLVLELKSIGHEVYEYDLGNSKLESYTKGCEFVYHLAGVNRPKDGDFSGNYTSLEEVLNLLRRNDNLCPVMLASSIQAELDNDYGKSKLEAEKVLAAYEGKQYIYRFPNVYGPGCAPHYNSVVATWCYSVANDIPMVNNDPDRVLELAYIEDVVHSLVCLLDGNQYSIKTNKISLHDLAEMILGIKAEIDHSVMPAPEEDYYALRPKLRTTYLYYHNSLNEMEMHKDNRGSFTELYYSNCGQVSVNTIKPGETKGGHYHRHKYEMFSVVSGNCEIVEKNIFTGNIRKYLVSGEEIVNVYMLPCWAHSIKNIGTKDAIVVMWASEVFMKNNPDTYMYN